MTPESDPAVRLETVAAAAGLALFTLRRAIAAGKIPPPDALLWDGSTRPANVWRLSTIRAWNPRIADRCAAILAALDSIPLKAA